MDDLLDEEVQEDMEIFEEGENLEHVENEPDEQNQDDQNDENKDDEDGDKEKKVKAKRVVRNPRVTLNAERLKGPKGLGSLEKHFENVKFKGKGYEEEDLNVLLKNYEYWCHRLFPKFPFQECVKKIEVLGTKRPIQTHMIKIRSGLVDEEIEPSNTEGDLPNYASDEEETERNSPPPAAIQAIMDDIPIELTEEQLETIRQNREKAEQIRQERLRKIREKAAVNMPESNGMIASSSRSDAVEERAAEAVSRTDALDSDEEISRSSRKFTQTRLDDSSDEECNENRVPQKLNGDKESENNFNNTQGSSTNVHDQTNDSDEEILDGPTKRMTSRMEDSSEDESSIRKNYSQRAEDNNSTECSKSNSDAGDTLKVNGDVVSNEESINGENKRTGDEQESNMDDMVESELNGSELKKDSEMCDKDKQVEHEETTENNGLDKDGTGDTSVSILENVEVNMDVDS